MNIWYNLCSFGTFSGLGIMYLEKSGNPGLHIPKSIISTINKTRRLYCETAGLTLDKVIDSKRMSQKECISMVGASRDYIMKFTKNGRAA
jgi:hypothetical protein